MASRSQPPSRARNLLWGVTASTSRDETMDLRILRDQGQPKAAADLERLAGGHHRDLHSVLIRQRRRDSMLQDPRSATKAVTPEKRLTSSTSRLRKASGSPGNA